jgi:hypothetical protein
LFFVLSSRVSPPRSIKTSVLEDFSGRCAACGAPKPRLHLIDENEPRGDARNWLPLCPNEHLFDFHDPTTPIAAQKLRLLRQFKDPSVLKPQFQPIFRRLQWLDEIGDTQSVETLTPRALELVNFLVAFEMGIYYGGRVHELLKPPAPILPPAPPSRGLPRDATQQLSHAEAQYDEALRTQMRNSRDEVFFLCVEMLRFQKW